MSKLLLAPLLFSVGSLADLGRLIRGANAGERRLLQESPTFAWSYKGPIEGQNCVRWLETADEHTWHDNYLCSPTDYDIQWNSAGPISGMRCTQIHEASDPDGTWHDNYLCVPESSGLQFEWSNDGPIAADSCVQIVEPAEPSETTWHDNYLCYSWVDPTPRPTPYPTPADAFSIIFIADVESDYRGHTIDECANVVNWVKNIAQEGFTFDGEYAAIPVTPDLVIHGGDISDGTNGNWAAHKQILYPSGASDYLYHHIWGQLYEADIPMISALGNHDYDPVLLTDDVHRFANEFVLESYRKTENLVGNDFSYTEYAGTSNVPSLFKSEFRGLQIVNLNYYALLDPVNENQFYDLSADLDYEKKTIFFGHVPLKDLKKEGDGYFHKGEYHPPQPAKATAYVSEENLVSQFSDTTYLSGHVHSRGFGYTSFPEYIAAYSHLVRNSDGNERPAGVYAVLVSPTQGVLNVKPIEIPYRDVSGCWADGTVCDSNVGTCDNCCIYQEHEYWWGKAYEACGFEPKWEDGTICALGTTCNACQNEGSYWFGSAFTACGSEPKTWEDGTICADGTTCNVCINGFSYWWGKAITACGSEPKWGDGTSCAVGTTCNACRNEASYWYGSAFTACGSEPKTWTDGTICADGTTCNVCINGFSYWYSLAFTACGSEQKWGDGTMCALGTTCNACQNSATHWTGAGHTACGSEPCWGQGTTCGTGTTCNSCCSGNHNAYCPWYWFGVCECGY